MNKNTAVIIGTVVVVVIMAVVIWITTPINPKTKEQINTIPKPEVVKIPSRPIDNGKSETGALYISPTDSEYIQMSLIGDLRDKCPIENSAFKIDFNYKNNKFVVTLKEPKEENKKLYEKWVEQAGYNQIDLINFESIQ